MGIVAAYIMPHPPLAVEGVGGSAEKYQIRDSLSSYDAIAKEIAAIRPDTIIVTSPHSTSYSDYFHISPGPGARGDFSMFGATASMEHMYDTEFVRSLSRFCGDAYFPAGTEGEDSPMLDHGTMVPLFFVDKYYTDYKLVRIGLSGLTLNEHLTFGKFIQKVSDVYNKKLVFIASGDLSHYQSEDGPYGYRPEGPLYDEKLMDTLKQGDLTKLLEFDSNLLDMAGECGHRSFAILAGALYNEKYKTRVLSHEAPFGVGYGFCCFDISKKEKKGNNEFAQTLESAMDRRQKLWEEAMRMEFDRYYAAGTQRITAKMEAAIMEYQEKDEYVALARRTINAIVLGQTLPSARDESIPEELRTKRAGAFVSIHKGEELRGCIGTILATKKTLADEIIANAVSASTQDPRFPEVNEDELSEIDINVDVLTEPQIANSMDELDPKIYGVIVQNGGRLGVLLPDLPGVDTVETQISIAMQKAGIGPGEPIELMKFTVERHI